MDEGGGMTDIDRILAERYDRRGFMRMAGASTLGAAVLAACKKAETSGAVTGTSGEPVVHPPIEQEPGNLQVFDWSGYGDGTYYPTLEREGLWQQYTDATGDTPTFILYENDDAAYTKVVAGARYDISHPYTYKYQDWVDLGVLQPWDTSLIENFPALNPKLEASGVIDGQQYFIPVDWGFIAPIVNLDHVDVQEETFGILFDDRYGGKISWVDTSNMMYIAGIFLQVSDPFDMTDEELVQVRDFLISKLPLVRNFWNQSYQFWKDFRDEEVWIGYSWPDTAGYADAAGMNYLYMEPKEGRVSWVGGLGLFKDSQNYYHAHEYTNSWASTKAAEFLMRKYYYGHTNTEVDLSVIPPGVIAALGLDDPTVLDPPRAIPEAYIPRRSLYQQYWAEVRAS
jgi:spermidine/putrescine transport system substrate-binding protein